MNVDRIYQRLLILRCQAGDGRALEELIQRFDARLLRFVRRLLGGDQHEAQDVLQDVWLDVWRQIGRLEDPDALAAWLFRIVRDRAWRILRRRGISTMPLSDAAASFDVDETLDADERRVIAQSLDRLACEHREILILRFVEEMSYEQIASAVGCAVGTVRSRLHYAKQEMRRLLTQRT